ncbi:Outer membrane receptor proteins, mostly Fe transport [Reichenbachiella faecimaris]|uniref:Outer membrane receptor proteins, mostly Fe transport n=1 Tax=Reichenbachiella faecimaris TaxID=692418 RepID=A0A1W2GDC8_REIFA|nr:TonB-dependent receptor [Reichenbachiella faecimaris]SMD34670.1 Outer membrane receptor proteins, mostly Fe transport [Reichenbachiella faecimaris]
MKRLILATMLSFLILSVRGQGYTMSGYLKDASNGETLIGATVLIKGTTQGAITNVYGFYSLTLPADTYEVEFRYIGFISVEQTVDLTSGNQRVDIELPEESQQLDEIVISAEPEDINVSGIQMSSNKLDIQTIQKMPSFMGESDVIKSIQFLPGVSTVGEGASGFNVRGGSVGQNMILLDEAPVYNSSHCLGFFSVFNPDAVKDVNLIKGGIPARYGGRIASVLDIRMKEGNSKEFTAEGGIGTIFSRFAVEGPIAKEKASFILAGRRSYIDIIAKPFVEELDNGAGLNFYDLTLKTNWNINENNRVYLSGYWGKDNFNFDEDQGFSWGNRTATLRWNHIFNERLFSNFTIYTSDYKYLLAFGEDQDNEFDWSSRVKNFSFKPEFTFFINPENEISFGGETLYFSFEPANASGVSEGEIIDFSLEQKHVIESTTFVSNNQKIGNNVELEYGVRLSSFALLGSGKSITYGDTTPGTRKPVVGVESHNKGDLMQSYHNLEPRFAMKYQLNDYSSLKASYNKTSQYIHLISNTTASNPLDVWTPSSNNIKPQIGHQIALGWFRNFGPDNNLELSAETYYRKTLNQIDYINGADLLINEYLEGDLLSGEGRAYGLEIIAKKNTGKFTGWVSYTLAKTELKVDGINNDNWYDTRYDQRHNFKAAVFYDTENRWSFSANFSFLTGTPTTFPTSRYYVGDYAVPHVAGNERNGFRIPNYHRLDLSATLQGKTLNKKGELKKYHSYWVFSIYNVYGKQNPFSIYFSQDNDAPISGDPISTQATQVSIIGTMMPAISYNFKF